MPTVTLYRHGITASVTNGGNPNPPKRGRISGWSESAARRNVNFLRSVDETGLSGIGFAVTFTLRDCPPTPEAWGSLVRSWVKRQRRRGMLRLHWVMEFQRRGVPHLHAVIWFDPEDKAWSTLLAIIVSSNDLAADWVELAERYRAGLQGQRVKYLEEDGAPIVGWFMYVAKHVGRSKRHYQRQRESMPEAWSTSGRVWGYCGEWSLQDRATAEVTPKAFYRLRRLVKAKRLAEARASLPLNRRQVSHLRRLLKSCDRDASSVRPISEWIPEDAQVELLRVATGTA